MVSNQSEAGRLSIGQMGINDNVEKVLLNEFETKLIDDNPNDQAKSLILSQRETVVNLWTEKFKTIFYVSSKSIRNIVGTIRTLLRIDLLLDRCNQLIPPKHFDVRPNTREKKYITDRTKLVIFGHSSFLNKKTPLSNILLDLLITSRSGCTEKDINRVVSATKLFSDKWPITIALKMQIDRLKLVCKTATEKFFHEVTKLVGIESIQILEKLHVYLKNEPSLKRDQLSNLFVKIISQYLIDNGSEIGITDTDLIEPSEKAIPFSDIYYTEIYVPSKSYCQLGLPLTKVSVGALGDLMKGRLVLVRVACTIIHLHSERFIQDVSNSILRKRMYEIDLNEPTNHDSHDE